MNLETNENKEPEKIVDAIEVKKKWNRPKGLKYNKKSKVVKEKTKRPHSENCKCVSCTYKKTGQTNILTKEEIIKEYIDSLPADEIIFVLTPENLDVIFSKLQVLKEKFPTTNYRDFINKIINYSIENFLTAIDNGK